MTAVAEEIVWVGAEPLRGFLRPVGDLTLNPDNPWRGDVEEIRKSVRRFGQVRAVLVDAAGMIVAGNHRYLAMVAEGFTHVAAIPGEWTSADDARDYGLADNRIGQLGGYDVEVLLTELDGLAGRGSWEGTGYTQKDADRLRELEARAAAPVDPLVPPDPPGPEPPPGDDLREVTLMFDADQREAFGVALRSLMKEYGTDGVTETVLQALREEAALDG